MAQFPIALRLTLHSRGAAQLGHLMTALEAAGAHNDDKSYLIKVACLRPKQIKVDVFAPLPVYVRRR